VFWVISVYFNIRNTLLKSGTFLLGHPVYLFSLCGSICVFLFLCLVFLLFHSNFFSLCACVHACVCMGASQFLSVCLHVSVFRYECLCVCLYVYVCASFFVDICACLCMSVTLSVFSAQISLCLFLCVSLFFFQICPSLSI
jgi:hypothetical protein